MNSIQSVSNWRLFHYYLISALACFCCVESYDLRTTPVSPGQHQGVKANLLDDSFSRSSGALACRRQVLGDFGLMALAPLCFAPSPARGLSPEEAATAYDSYASTYDDLDGGKASSLLGIEEARSALFGKARGSVLEIGAGTGLNLNKYNLSQISSLTLLDVSDGMLQEARKRVSSVPAFSDISVRFVKADATSELVERFGLGAFDTVLDSFSLCVMGNEGARRCLDQVRQVVKSEVNGGKNSFVRCPQQV
jgi:hypothetical protein